MPQSVWNEIRVTDDGVSVTLYSEDPSGHGPIVEDEWWMTHAEIENTPHGIASLRVSEETLERGSQEEEVTLSTGDVVEDLNPPSYMSEEAIGEKGQLIVDEVLPPEVTCATWAFDEEASTDDMSDMEQVFAQTVADANPSYPDDDRVVLARYKDSDSQYAFPASRLAKVGHGAV
jgi:hypothetical protein